MGTHYNQKYEVPQVVAGWRLCDHARQTMAERGFSLEDVRAALNDPHQTYPSNNYGPGRRIHQRGRVTVVVHPERRLVITFLLRSYPQWTNADARRANGLAS